MNPAICQFISEAVYDSRLHPEAHNVNQALVLDRHAHPSLRPSGVQFISATHDGCSQVSIQEGQIVKALVDSLLGQRFRDNRGIEHPFGMKDILVVAPYNMQVNHLKCVLPDG
jgi:hypothetical protein